MISAKDAERLYRAQHAEAIVTASLRASKIAVHTNGTWVKPKPTLDQLDRRI